MIICRLENVDVSSVRFEISSLLRQSHERLPKGVSYPTLMGGEVVSGMASHNAQKLLLTYLVNADIQPELIKNFVKENVVRQLEAVDGVNKVEVTGTTDTYVEISYDPMALSAYGITSNDIANGIRNYIGQDEIIGTVMHTTAQGNQEKIALHLTTELFGKPLGEMPLKNIDGKVVYLNDFTFAKIRLGRNTLHPFQRRHHSLYRRGEILLHHLCRHMRPLVLDGHALALSWCRLSPHVDEGSQRHANNHQDDESQYHTKRG
jgi:multidrug efflux pump subunit AcrB